jgi:uncharacterized membrane protein YphA (DoxX/SURF4 family)
MSAMNILLWILQVIFGVYFIFVGISHFIVPPGLPAPVAWMYELPPWLHWFSGVAEILAGLGLILPGVTKIQPRLTIYAALGIVVLMIGAAVWYLTRGEPFNIVQNILIGAISAFIAYGRWKLSPLPERGTGSESDAV